MKTVLCSKTGSVFSIVLNRTEVINAFNVQMRDELYMSLGSACDDPTVKVIAISGAGERGFCAGADLGEFGSAPSIATAREVRWERDLWGMFLSVKKPVIVALHGYVIGSGLEIACLGDIRIASRDAVFSMPEAALGLLPAAGGSQTLARVVGQSRAVEILQMGIKIDADKAKNIGLVHEVIPRKNLHDRLLSVSNSLASINPSLLAAVKRSVNEGMDLSLEGGIRLEKRLAASSIQAL